MSVAVGLRKELSLLDVYAIATGATLSAGVFLLPGLAASQAGPARAAALLSQGLIPFRYPYLRDVLRGMKKGWFPVFVTHPLQPVPRYGYGSGPHPELYALLERERDSYRSRLRGFKRYEASLFAIESSLLEDGGARRLAR